MRRADLALYQAKHDGGNRARHYDFWMERELTARDELLHEMRQALLKDQFVLYFQPIWTVDSIEPIAVEALLRWNHPERGLLGAGEFIDVLENHGGDLARGIGRWVLHRAVMQLGEWRERGCVSVHANVSARYFLHRQFVQDLSDALGYAPEIDRKALVLELTETALLSDLDRAAKVMRECRELGVRFALDDFGTGFASLTYLKRLPVDSVKIDRSFVRDLCEGTNDHAIVRGILAMARALDLDVVAEGVESEEQIKLLRDLGCPYLQGYGLGMPAPVGEDLDALLFHERP